MKKSFTFLEIIVVLVVIGILTAVALPRLQMDNLQEAADQILSHIRYTQHLALVDDRFDPKDSNWYKKRWRISFRQCNSGTWYYIVYRDSNEGGNANENESATNPTDGKLLYNTNTCNENNLYSSEILIGQKYGIQNIDFSAGCNNSNQYIAFDYIGRPYSQIGNNPIDGVMHQDCNITFTTSENSSFTITISKETGYARITSIND